ncbi:MAG: VTT domain-containing protein [Chloroflexi bacterium]|nr:VTT domain-containing protein [Chloroflexota bacterium]MBT4003366.1 VTT domain-containing protein [Chloroflexota bacterium]MBT4305939.1 VTT domain-containing protein [Chloroflexota bacterium]MBT4533764.1 VTT domain-containing protein [Chloroflexota bacterium]MBT4681592.1 VTT domain-containing protein [Chloroflexota bacterium]
MKNNQKEISNKKIFSFIKRLGAILAVVAISLYIFFIPEDQLTGLENFGYAGVFLFSVITNATIFLPAPGLLIVFSLGARLNPILIAVTAGLGSAIGELSGYLAGYSGRAIIDKKNIYTKLVNWMKKNGELTILVMAFIPNPFFDLTGIAAGILKMPVWKFLFWAFIGKFFKMLLIALAGAGTLEIPWIKDLLTV